jgi:hypothetical protein
MRAQQDCAASKSGVRRVETSFLIAGRKCWMPGQDGGLNQAAVSMIGFRDALYVGTGIQNGGYDWRNKIGPAAAEIIRVNADGSWDIIVGNARDGKESLS